MTGFNDLPNEIVLELWHHVLPPDNIASFALVSKRIFALAAASLKEHHRLKSKYAIFESDGSTDGSMLAHRLKDVLLYPYIAFYVKNIRICDWHTCWEDPIEDSALFPELDDVGNYTSHVPYPEQEMTLFKESIRKAENLFPRKEDVWIRLLENGHEDPILALLLSLLPNLCTLSLEDYPVRTRLFTAIHRIAETTPSTCFSKLKNVELSHSVPNPSNHIKPFLLLPSVEKISCYNLDDYLRTFGVPNSRVASQSSNLTELIFDSCRGMADYLSVLLKEIKELKKFSYVAAGDTVDAPWIRSNLLDHCRQSLEYLKMDSESDLEYSAYLGRLGSLRSFENLKILHVEHSLLVDPDACGSRAFDIAELLPTSIEVINLTCHYHYPSEVISLIRPFVRSLAIAKRTWLPNLKILKCYYFEFHNALEYLRNHCNDLCQLCGEEGISLTFQ